MLELKLFVQQKCPKCPAAKAVAEELKKRREDVEVKILDITDKEHYLIGRKLVNNQRNYSQIMLRIH